MAWYREWFGADYLELYAHRDEAEAERHVDFAETHLGGVRPAAVLDLACGAGRHAAALARRGYRVFGVDLSVTLLAHPPRVRAAAGDMCRLPIRDAVFDWVLNFFTSFGYFESERENFRVLEEIRRVLRPGGRFLIDFLNRDHVLANLRPRETQELHGRRVEIERWYDERRRRINKRMRLHAPGRPVRTYLESVRAYTREEVIIGLRWAGLEADAVFGSFAGEPHGPESERLIIIGHKSD
ncbi:MAG: class I SAM-dependent methyltransferase [Acidobacteria bacterium]|nr:MAG: class I SAM-dependent methyltransferase [Acidobacteriota bacterium]